MCAEYLCTPLTGSFRLNTLLHSPSSVRQLIIFRAILIILVTLWDNWPTHRPLSCLDMHAVHCTLRVYTVYVTYRQFGLFLFMYLLYSTLLHLLLLIYHCVGGWYDWTQAEFMNVQFWFLGIILKVLRFEVSAYNVYISNQFQTIFAWGWVGDCE